MNEQIQLAVVGGSGFYEMPGLTDANDLDIETPFGATSSSIRVGTLDGVRIAFLARHGRRHHLLPSEIPQRANFWALKSLGVERVLAVSAVGSLREDYAPGDAVVPDQLVDRTLGARPSTFFGDGIVAHVSMAEPFCPTLADAVATAAGETSLQVHVGGSYVAIEGPAFGSRAESELYRSWGVSLVGMTALPEAKFAREAELCYAMVAMVTDYDAWHDGHAAVDAETIFRMLSKNVAMSREVIHQMVGRIPTGACNCRNSLDTALVTQPADIPETVRERLAPILARRLGTVEAQG